MFIAPEAPIDHTSSKSVMLPISLLKELQYEVGRNRAINISRLAALLLIRTELTSSR
jgi:hypothetical protein